MIYQKNLATQQIYFVLVSVATPATAVTGATVTAKRSIDGGAQASCTGTIVEDGGGQYHLVTSAADTNGSHIGFLFTATGCYPVSINAVTADGTGLWDVPTANHTAAGSTGKAVADAAAAVVPNTIAATVWNYLTSAFATPGSIGNLLLAQLDVNVGSTLAASAYTAPSNASIASILAKTNGLPGAPAAVSDIPTANAVADALLDRADAIEPTWTPRQALKVILAALGGKLSGAATTNVLVRDLADTKNRINATVDVNGNRTAVTYDKS